MASPTLASFFNKQQKSTVAGAGAADSFKSPTATKTEGRSSIFTPVGNPAGGAKSLVDAPAKAPATIAPAAAPAPAPAAAPEPAAAPAPGPADSAAAAPADSAAAAPSPKPAPKPAPKAQAAASPKPAAAGAAAASSPAQSSSTAGPRDLASLQAELDSIYARNAGRGDFAQTLEEKTGMKLDNELRKSKGEITNAIVGVMVQGKGESPSAMGESVFEQLKGLSQSAELSGTTLQLPESAAIISDRLSSGIAERVQYGDGDSEDAKLFVWEMKPDTIKLLPKAYQPKVKAMLKETRTVLKNDKKRIVLLRKCIKALSKAGALDKLAGNPLKTFLKNCDKLAELAQGPASPKPQGAASPSAGGLPTSGAKADAPVSEEEAKRAAELKEQREKEKLLRAAEKEEAKAAKLAEKERAKKQKEEDASRKKKQQEEEALRNYERLQKEMAEKAEKNKAEKAARDQAKAAEQAKKAALREEQKAAQEEQKAADKAKKEADKKRKAEERRLEKERKDAEREAAKKQKQEQKVEKAKRKAEEEAQREADEKKKQAKKKNAWASFGFTKQAAPSASPKPVKKPSGPQKVLWKWEAEKEAWKLEQVQKNDPSEAFRTAAAQLPWKFNEVASESLTEVVSGMRRRQQAAPRKRRWAGRPVKFLDFRGCPFQQRHPPGHAKEGQCVRPPWYGPMPDAKTKSKIITARNPLAMEKEEVVDYDLESEDEYRDDAEDIENSDGEEDRDDGEGEEEGFVVPDGTFSDDEGVEGDGDRLIGIKTTSSAKHVVVMSGASLPSAPIHISLQVTICGPQLVSMYDCDESGMNLVQKEKKAQAKAAKEEEQRIRAEEKAKKQVSDHMLPDLAKIVHGTLKSKEKIAEELNARFPDCGKSQIYKKLDEVAKKKKRGDMGGDRAKNRWWMNEDVLESLAMTDADFGLDLEEMRALPSPAKKRSRESSGELVGNAKFKNQKAMGLLMTQTVANDTKATWEQLNDALEQFVRPAAAPPAAAPSPVKTEPGAAASPAGAPAEPEPLEKNSSVPVAEQELIALWDVLTTTEGNGEVRDANTESLRKILVEVANCEVAPASRSTLADLLTSAVANPSLQYELAPLLTDGLLGQLLKSISQPAAAAAAAGSENAAQLQNPTCRIMRLLKYFFKRHASAGGATPSAAGPEAAAALDNARMEMLCSEDLGVVFRSLACSAAEDPKGWLRGFAAGLLHHLLSVPTLKFKGVSFSAQEIEIKTAYGWFDACVAALKNEPTPAVAKFQALAMARLIELGAGSKMAVQSVAEVPEPLSEAFKLVDQDYRLVEAVPCALALVEHASPDPAISESVSRLLDVALDGTPHVKAQVWLARCCKQAGVAGAAKLEICPPKELRGKVTAVLQAAGAADTASAGAAMRAMLDKLLERLAPQAMELS